MPRSGARTDLAQMAKSPRDKGGLTALACWRCGKMCRRGGEEDRDDFVFTYKGHE